MGDRMCLVACSKGKEDSRKPSWKLYDSTLFEKSWAAASLVGDPYVMSAKHGIVSVDDRLDPYDETLKTSSNMEKIEWAKSLDIPSHYETLVLFGGRDYVVPIKGTYGDEYNIVDVYEECSGNGKQMAKAGKIVETIINGGKYL